MKKLIKAAILAASCLAVGAHAETAMDPNNPTCPAEPDWSANKQMELTPIERGGEKILLAEGVIDKGIPERLQKVLEENPDITEIWLRSPGGNARAGNAAGQIIRKIGGIVITRIPPGWTCFSACNFVFMGGRARIIDEGGHFMVHMFTMTGDRDAINYSIEMGTESTVGLIGEVEQESALLATEDNDFLIRMGVSRKLLSEIMYKQKAVDTGDGDKSTRRCLSREEAYRYNVANVDG
ncbi:hypothetical protein [Parasphingorhabdus sp.]|jgi:hypothetical protein|uniref:COG3904 family protein n=1 Tax=Parasphingorhabdus sp. TaxID=2709688 RepID=UPI0007F52253|nr:hypothetical protein A8B75_00305 [Sphingomonadales bacterium EhC05]